MIISHSIEPFNHVQTVKAFFPDSIREKFKNHVQIPQLKIWFLGWVILRQTIGQKRDSHSFKAFLIVSSCPTVGHEYVGWKLLLIQIMTCKCPLFQNPLILQPQRANGHEEMVLQDTERGGFSLSISGQIPWVCFFLCSIQDQKGKTWWHVWVGQARWKNNLVLIQFFNYHSMSTVCPWLKAMFLRRMCRVQGFYSE